MASPLAALSAVSEELQASDTMAAHIDHSAWTEILSAFVKPSEDGVNRFDYAGLKADSRAQARLELYIKELEQTDFEALSRDEQFAAWANLYNALTIQLVVAEYPIKSIMRIKPKPWSIGPWKKNITTVNGESLSLDDIEHGILRKQWNDPRVHYAVNCASFGCPNLQQKAWTAETLDADLNKAAIAYINHPRGVTVRADGRLELSTIYKWFREDFGDGEAGVINHLLVYASSDLASRIEATRKIADYSYDWSLNDLDL